MTLLVHSNKDIAGINIAKHILKNYPFTKTNDRYQQNPIYQTKLKGKPVTSITLLEESVNAQNLAEDFPDSDLVVFLSRHSSKSGTPTLSVHTPGNIGTAELGGLPRTVSISPANAMSEALRALHQLKNEMQLDYEVSYECTHHGPSLKVPTMFVELGSSEKQWKDQNASAVVAQAAMQSIANFGNFSCPTVLGIGGTHYNQKFTRLALDEKAIFGHMIPKYAVSNADLDILRQCVERTYEQVESVVLDWKGILSEDKPKLMDDLEVLGLPTRKV